jgi:hypothetical protein
LVFRQVDFTVVCSPFIKSNKNDFIDTEAICEVALTCPRIRYNLQLVMSVGFLHISCFASPLRIQLVSGNPAMNGDGTRYNPAASH